MSRVSRLRTFKAPEFRARGPRPTRPAGSEPSADVAAGGPAKPAWRVVVADGSEARIYTADRRIGYLKLLATMRNPAARKAERALVSSRGGSKFNRSSGNYQALSPTTAAHRASIEQFAKAIAVAAIRRLEAGEQLALVAAPRLLSLISHALSSRTTALEPRSVARDVMHEPATQLRLRLARSLGGPY